MKRIFRRRIAVGTAASIIVTLMTIASPAGAASIGNLTFTPAAGDSGTVMTLDTSGPCLSGTNLQFFVEGQGFPAAGYPVTASVPDSSLTVDPAGGYSVPLLASMQSFADQQNPPATLSGSYAFSGRCTDGTGATVLDTYDGSVVFTANDPAPATYAAVDVQVQVGYYTATALSANALGPLSTGVQVTFNAHVSSSPIHGAIGTVQLMDGLTAVGDPTTVDSSGNAAISTAFSTGGQHHITAAFTGKFTFIAGSVSAPLTFEVDVAPADATATSLSISPSTATAADSVTLTATVADVTTNGLRPVGSVQFQDRGVDVGGPVSLSSGTAALSRTFAAGEHSFTAKFVPTDPAAFAPSASTSQPYTVAASAGVTEPIETTVDAGSLTISVADASADLLTSPQLSPTAAYLSTTGALHAVTVTDTRAGNPGWVLSGQLSDFTNVTGSVATPIPAVDLGWTPAVMDASPGEVVDAGTAVPAATPPLLGDPTADHGDGLHESRTLASAAAGHGTGTTHVGAALQLSVPTTIVSGTYAAVLTLTAI